MDLMEFMKLIKEIRVENSEDCTDEPIVALKFSEFRQLCPYNSPVCEDGTWDWGCHERSIIPAGHSWAICNPDICPFLKV